MLLRCCTNIVLQELSTYHAPQRSTVFGSKDGRKQMTYTNDRQAMLSSTLGKGTISVARPEIPLPLTSVVWSMEGGNPQHELVHMWRSDNSPRSFSSFPSSSWTLWREWLVVADLFRAAADIKGASPVWGDLASTSLPDVDCWPFPCEEH
jgi:hypothetical protein